MPLRSLIECFATKPPETQAQISRIATKECGIWQGRGKWSGRLCQFPPKMRSAGDFVQRLLAMLRSQPPEFRLATLVLGLGNRAPTLGSTERRQL